MERRRLGRTGLEVSEVALGCGSFGGIGSAAATRGKGLGQDEALAVLDAAADLGVSLLDTADTYGGGVSERIVGSWMQAHPSTGAVVATKVGMGTGEDGPLVDLRPESVVRRCRASLERLGVERLELYQLHALDPATPLEATLSALAALIEEGVVGATGVCNVTAAQLSEVLAVAAREGLPRPEWVQNELSLMVPDDEQDVLGLCAAEQLGYLAHSPLFGGVLAGRYRLGEPPPPGSRLDVRPDPYRSFLTPEVLAGVAQLAVEAEDLGVSTAALSLAWVLDQPGVTSVLVAPRSPAQLDAAREAVDLHLDEAERARLRDLVPAPR